MVSQTVCAEPVLLFGYGNPSRGDDALGPALIEQIATQLGYTARQQQVRLLTDFQLQIEHALDLEGQSCAIFVDCASHGAAPFSFEAVHPEEIRYSTHELSPGAVLRVFEQVARSVPPTTWMLAIRGYRFDLGAPLTAAAEHNLAQAIRFLAALLLFESGPCAGDSRRT